MRYSGGKDTNAGKGFQWLKPDESNPQRVGFWTVGQPERNHGWVPTWDHPNDFATTETRVTVPADWYVVGNGELVSDKSSGDGKRRTFHWKMEQPHATYLLSLAGGPFDIKTSTWRGVKLMYVAQKGKGSQLESAFSATPDILSFYSDTLGVKYPWPKYSEAALYGYPGGMENVSATSFSEGVLGGAREAPERAFPRTFLFMLDLSKFPLTF